MTVENAALEKKIKWPIIRNKSNVNYHNGK